MPDAELEISIQRRVSGSTADVRFTSAAHDVQPAAEVPLALDLTTLRELHDDPAAYGRALTAQLFADARLRSAWQQARAVAQQRGTCVTSSMRRIGGKVNTYILPKTPRPDRYRWWHFVPMLLVIVTGCCSVVAPQLGPVKLDPLDGQVSRGTTRILIRLPETAGYLQEYMAVSGNGTSEAPWQVSRGPIGLGKFPVIQALTNEQWRQLASYRDAWCAHAPTFNVPTNQTQVYEMAFRCDETLNNNKRFIIPSKQLPSIFRELMTQIPSPQARRQP